MEETEIDALQSRSDEIENHYIEIKDLSCFEFRRVLSCSEDTKSIIVEGKFGNSAKSAIAILQKEPFDERDVKTFFSVEKDQEKVFQNDIYCSFRYLPKVVCNGIKITSIYPATEKHIKKYTYQPVHIINETPDLYKSVTLPCIQAEQFSLQWVYNVLEHKSESDRILLEDTDPEVGFILIPDLKWDGKTIETLYLLALPMKRGIFSIRDLSEKELPLLHNIHTKCLNLIQEKFSIPSSRIQAYFHYLPSFYHLHVHFTVIGSYKYGSERYHYLTTVINNISLIPNYYQLATLPFLVKETDPIFIKCESLGIVSRTGEKETNQMV